MARFNGRDSTTERDALLAAHRPFASHSKPTSTLSKIKTYLNKPVATPRADVLLIASFFISGVIDAGAYNAYECFTSMQTGNTVFAALGVSDLPISSPKYAWVKSVTSILSFFLGSLLLMALHRHFGERKRWVLSLAFLIQAVLIAISADLVRRGHSSGSPAGGGRLLAISSPSTFLGKDLGFPATDLLPIALLSFQAAGKVVASRVVGQKALPVVVLTTLYNDLISDPRLFTAGLTKNVQRNRRFGGMVFYFGGAVVGGVCASNSVGFSGALGVACGVQVLTAVGWLLWWEDKKVGDNQA